MGEWIGSPGFNPIEACCLLDYVGTPGLSVVACNLGTIDLFIAVFYSPKTPPDIGLPQLIFM